MHDDRASPSLLRQPRSRMDLFLAFTMLALQGFGGVMAVAQRELVENKRWLSREEFLEEWAVAQILPGPNVVNMSLMIGGRYFGLSGALAALAGMLAVPIVLLLPLALLYARYASHPGVAGALRGMGAVVAGMIAATGIKLLAGLRTHPLGFGVCTALALGAVAALAWLRWPLPYVLLGLGGVSCVRTFYRLT